MIQNLLASLLFITTSFANTDYSCVDENSQHPVRNEYMLQIILKSYNYYDGKIDGQIGPISTNALKTFQSTNSLDADGILGSNTCAKFLDKSSLIKKKETLKQSLSQQLVFKIPTQKILN